MAKQIIMPQHSFKESMRLLKRILLYFKPYKMRIVFAVIAMIFAALATAATAYLIQPALDKIFIEKDSTALAIIPPVFVFIELIKGVCRFAQTFIMEYCALHVLEELRDELYNKIIYLPLKFFEDNQVGMLMSRIINDVMLIRTSLPSIISIFKELITAVGLIALVIYRDPFLAAIGLLALPIAFLPFIYFGRRLRKIGRKSQATIADISTFLNEIFSGIRVLKAFSTEEKEAQRFADENKRLVNLAVKQAKTNQMSSPVMEFIGAIAAAIVIWYGGRQVLEGVSTPGTFFSFLAAMIMLYEPVKKVTDANNNIQQALASAERVFEVIDSPETIVESEGSTVLNEPFRELEFRNVTFAYNPEDPPALRNVSFSLKGGERIAIVGPSGAGKSTFVNLIPRFYDQQEGEILINGLPTSEYTLRSLRNYVSLVSQDTFLFNTSVMENIGYGTAMLDPDKVRKAAALAYADEFIEEMPEKYNTKVGERGVKISGGQKQRLTIARAIYKDSPLLILDEATSALDSESERIVQKALENLMQGRTSIVIAHRLSTVLNADRILVMDQGRVVAEGTHTSLLKTSPLYKKLCTLQFMDAADALEKIHLDE